MLVSQKIAVRVIINGVQRHFLNGCHELLHVSRLPAEHLPQFNAADEMERGGRLVVQNRTLHDAYWSPLRFLIASRVASMAVFRRDAVRLSV